MTTTLLDPASQPRFTNHLTRPAVLDARLGGSYVITAQQSQTTLGLINPFTGLPLTTTVWGYGTNAPVSVDPLHPAEGTAGYGGVTILARSNVPIQVKWANALPTDLPGGHLLPVDMSMDMNMPGHGAHDAMGHTLIPTVVHLHGGHTRADSDGYPINWVTQDPLVNGTTTQPEYYTYDNSQQGATLWYHDHSMNITRLNVFAGLAGTYVIEDQNKLNLVAAGALPTTLGDFDTPLMIQDKSFKEDGQLYFPGAAGDDPIPGTTDTVADGLPPDFLDRGGQYPTTLPEYFGDFIMVNGQAWPHQHVEQADYVYHLVNGSDSRFYVIQLSNPNVKMFLIGGDGGLMPTAKLIMDGDGTQEQGEQVVLGPGERLDLMLDFSNTSVGDVVQMLNVGPAFEPFKGLLPDGSLNIATAATTTDSTGQIMAFKVRDTLSAANEFHSTIVDGTVLNPNFVAIDPVSADHVRRLGLFEGEDQWGRIHPLLGTAEDTVDINGQPIKAGPVSWETPITEAPKLGDTEIWQIFNTTEDAHPIHLHLVEFQVLGRYTISETDLDGDGYLNDLGAPITLYPEDMGSQDTVWVGPGEALKVIGTWDRPGEYVWHCHIVSHEDHTMMRPLTVINTVDGTNTNNTLTGTADVDRITGGKGNDTAHGGAAGDLFIATKGDGNDRYYGDEGSDTLDMSAMMKRVEVDLDACGRVTTGPGNASGEEIGADRLYSIENVLAGAGNDSISGSDADNFISGGAGRDVILGAAGMDRILGGEGNDRMSGGAGSDSFLFYRELGATAITFGRDVITDFKVAGVNHDMLEIDNRIFASFEDMVAAHAIVTRGNHVVISYDAQNSITLENVSLAALTANAAQDFLFV